MRLKLFLCLIVCLLVGIACVPIAQPIILTATPLPPTPSPTPTREPPDEQWYEGCDISPHCNSTYAMIEVNPNPGLDAGVARTEIDFSIAYLIGQAHTRTVNVAFPVPDQYYRWDANGRAIDGFKTFEGAMPPISEYNRNGDAGFAVNVSGWEGELLLTNVVQTLYTSPGWYAIGLEYIPAELHTYDPMLARDPNIMFKRCRVHADNGITYPLIDQSFAIPGWDGWEDATPQDVVYALHVERDVTVMVSCGVVIQHASLDGQIVFNRFHITPVEPGWGEDTATIIR